MGIIESDASIGGGEAPGDFATKGNAVFEIYSESDFPTPAAGISTLISGKYILKAAVTLSAIEEFQCAPNAVIEWQSEDKENHTLTHVAASKILFNFTGGSRFKIEHASFILTGNGAQFISMTGANFNSKVNDFRVIFTGSSTTIGSIIDTFQGTNEFIDGTIFGFQDGLTVGNTGGIQIVGVFFGSDGVGADAIIHVQNINALAVNLNTNVFITGPSQSNFFIDPVIKIPVQILDNITTGSSVFFEVGTKGTFTAVADASIGATAITSVTDSSGVARFNYTGSTVYVNQEVVLSAFSNYTNGTYIITAAGAGYFEISSIAYSDPDTGSFLSNSITLTDTGTVLSDGDTIALDTTNSTDYDSGTYVYNKQTNTVQVNKTWASTESGTWDQGSLTEKSRYLNVLGNGEQADSISNASMFVSGNVGTISTSGSGTWDPLNLVAALEGQSINRFKVVNAITGEIEYTGLNRFEGGLAVAISAFKSAAAIVNHKFRAFKTVGSGAFDIIEPTRGLSTALASISLVTSIQLDPGDRFRIEIASQAAVTTVTIQDVSLTTG